MALLSASRTVISCGLESLLAYRFALDTAVARAACCAVRAIDEVEDEEEEEVLEVARGSSTDEDVAALLLCSNRAPSFGSRATALRVVAMVSPLHGEVSDRERRGSRSQIQGRRDAAASRICLKAPSQHKPS